MESIFRLYSELPIHKKDALITWSDTYCNFDYNLFHPCTSIN